MIQRQVNLRGIHEGPPFENQIKGFAGRSTIERATYAARQLKSCDFPFILAGMLGLTGKERAFVTAILAVVIALVASDLWTDWNAGASARHLASEAFIGALALAGILVLWLKALTLSRRVEALGRDLESAREDAKRWQAENAHWVQGLREAIDRQLEAWGLTAAEKDIALFLIKGLSLKEIAQARNTSERTVRQQTVALYGKAGLSGRAELAAYFLEDLFPA